ncbi:MAG: hypothetical protein A2W90_00115 [Bacteroidetes bacterium GWF2_42_66]|nr:MAG: hypothetical protein A2W92_09295 [Bacteroidetes bacterium GWA2_42_15]OFX97889.1 MAG: hypothetical protein A2W89_07470 [Bacteroidetes bacterium GWE2_42_39]OFY44134.1 MAG: hypothetical protein A2W90_00115 [Bacteroidetes bacterium GWF2_42_66]HAZ03407.1 alpha-galactosidase [Marinilabiliales bacterium]HBL74622.1 alpha-galactosidase [Prolixibacteraceae bacterium]
MEKLFPYILGSLLFILSCNPKKQVILSELDINKVQCGWGVAQQDKSVVGKPLTIGGVKYETGIGVHADSKFLIFLNCNGDRFTALAGLDDASNEKGSVEFYVLGDQQVLWKSGIMKKGDAAKKVDVKIVGIEKLALLVTGGGDGIENDYADWVNANIAYNDIEPIAIDNSYLPGKEEILTPVPPSSPRINGPKIYGTHLGSPFLYRIPATGERPMSFSITNLPKGLILDKNTGIITGKTEKAGTYETEITTQNAVGSDKREFKIVVGNTLALTPPMGWNSWYIYYHQVSDSAIRSSADFMIRSGMADFGYQYVNIDDCWAIKNKSNDPIIGGGMRDENGEIRTNKRFPNMKALTGYIHQKGLKAGIYSSPGPTTCGGYAGSYKHEKQDIQTFAQWGFDFLKYDWCSYGRVEKERTREACIKPFKLMWDELQNVNRDIIFNLCQYGMADSWEWAGTMGNSWRTTGDLGILDGVSLPAFYYIGLFNSKHWKYARPGAWNDPDYLLIGWVRNALKDEEFEKTGLTPNEQYSYMSLWSLMAAPLFFSGDMGLLDPFTLNILCNNEVIDIDQDILGHQARIITSNDDEFIMAKELEGGAKAVGLFYVPGNASAQRLSMVDNEANGMSDVMGNSVNPVNYFVWDNNPVPKVIRVNASDINIEGKFKVRDVWRQKDLGVFENYFETSVPFHGVMLLKITEE